MKAQAHQSGRSKKKPKNGSHSVIRSSHAKIKSIDVKVIPELGVTVEQYNRELDEAVAEYKRGEFVAQSEMKKPTTP